MSKPKPAPLPSGTVVGGYQIVNPNPDVEGQSYALSWVQALMGLSVGSVEAANSAGFLWMFPLTFVSSAFVDTASMPDWLQTVADANPFTQVTNATRALYNGKPAGSALWISLAWSVGLIAVFSTLAIRKFNASTSR